MSALPLNIWASPCRSAAESDQCNSHGKEEEREVKEVWLFLTHEADRGGKNVLSSRWTRYDRGGKKLPTNSFPTIPNPLTHRLHSERREEGIVAEEEESSGEEGNENANCREMGKVLNGKREWKNVGGQKKKSVKNAFNIDFRATRHKGQQEQSSGSWDHIQSQDRGMQKGAKLANSTLTELE